MGKTGISWATNSLNVIYKKVGIKLKKPCPSCIPISEECKNCYASSMAMKGTLLGDGKKYQSGLTYEDMYLDRKKLHRELGMKIRTPQSVFICSMTDWAAVNEFVRMEWALEILEACRQSRYLCYLLSKRADCLPEIIRKWRNEYNVTEWPNNVWMGFTAGNQARFNERWAYFTNEGGVLDLFERCNVFVSYEPALGPLVLPINFYCTKHIGRHGETYYFPDSKVFNDRFLIAGGESKTLLGKPRPPKPEWFESIKDQCLKNGVGFHFKQWGDADEVARYKKNGDNLLFGKSYQFTPLSG